MKVLVHSRRRPSAVALAKSGAEFVPDLEALLPAVDVVSLHAPATPETRGMMNAARLGLLKPGAALINTARGDLVDESALIDALRQGRISAGLDVYVHEPQVPAQFLTFDNVVLLPHLGSATEETRTAMGMRAVANLRAYFRDDTPPDVLDKA